MQDLLKLSPQMLIAEPKGPILTSVNIVKDVIGVMNVQNIRLRNARIVLEEVVISV